MYESKSSQGQRISGSLSLPRAQTQVSHQRTQLTAQNTVQIPMSDLMRIQQKCFGNDENSKQREKLEMLEKSKERIKKWPNTINALRKKKDATRFERFKVDEEERRRVEEEEKQYQMQVKKEILEKANLKIYENNDRIRAFQSKLLITDIHQEREGQLELIKFKKEVQKNQEQMHFEQILEQVQKDEEQEKQKQALLLKKKQETHKVLSDQHDEMKNKYLKQLQDQKVEGEILKMNVQVQLEREEEAKRLRKERQLQNQVEMRQGNEILQEMKKVEQLKDKEYEDRIKQHALKKDAVVEMRKKREELKMKEKQVNQIFQNQYQDQRQKLIDIQIVKLQQQHNQREQILNKQIVEAQVKADNAEKLKLEKRIELAKRIEHSRKIGEIFKSEENERKKMSDIEYQAYWKQRNNELHVMEKQEIDQIKGRNVQLKDYHLRQAEERLKQREQEIYNDMEEQQNILRKKENEDKNFGSWAEKCIREWKENGKGVGPMIKELTLYKQK